MDNVNSASVSSSGGLTLGAKAPEWNSEAQLKKQLSSIHKEAMTLQKEMSIPTKQLAKLAVTIPDSSALERLSSLSSAIKTKKQSIQGLKSQLQSLDKKMPNQKLAQQILRIQSELVELEATLTYQEATITNLQADVETFSEFAAKQKGSSDTQRQTLSTLMTTVNKATKSFRQGVSKPRFLHSPRFRGDLNERMQTIGTQIATCNQTLSNVATWSERTVLDYRKQAYGVAEKLNALRVKHEAFTTVFDDHTRLVLATPALVSDKLEGLNKENAHTKINLALDELDKGKAELRLIPEGTARYVIAEKALQAAEQKIMANGKRYYSFDKNKYLAGYFQTLNTARHYRKCREEPKEFFNSVRGEPNRYIQTFSLLIAHDRLLGEGTFTLQWETLSPGLKSELMGMNDQFKELVNSHIAQTADRKLHRAIDNANESSEFQEAKKFYEVALTHLKTIPDDPKFIDQYNAAVSKLSDIYQKLSGMAAGDMGPDLKQPPPMRNTSK